MESSVHFTSQICKFFTSYRRKNISIAPSKYDVSNLYDLSCITPHKLVIKRLNKK